MIYYLDCLKGECWWGGAVAQGGEMPLCGGVAFYEDLNGIFNSTDNQYNALFVSNKGRYIYAEKGCTLRYEGDFAIRVSSLDGEADISEGHGSLKGAYRAAVQKHFPKGGTVPKDMVLLPQYNSWVEMLRGIDQKKVEAYAESIVESGLPVGTLILDDGWMRGYGDWEFDPSKFSDPAGMINNLHRLGFCVILWVCPFVDEDVPDYTCLEKDALVRDRFDAVAIRRWWSGRSAVLDMSSPSAQDWMEKKLNALMRVYGVDGFKFDAGDPLYYDYDDRTFRKVTPNDQSALWAQFASKYKYAELRACVGMGGYPIVQRLSDKNNSWTGKKGIRSLIPNMLQAGITGYPYCCPDMVGGGQESDFGKGSVQNDEFLIRSCECAALMTMIQFSYAIWNKGSETARKVVKSCLDLRQSYADYFKDLLEECALTGDPLMRHMEYEFPEQGFEKITDQFMLGEKLLVAPVLEQGARMRDVALPSGCKWLYKPTGEVFGGGQTVRVSAPLAVLPYFERV